MGAAVGLALASVVWAQDAGDAASWSALGRSLRREQRPAEAEAALRRALQLSPQAEDENLLGLLLFEQQRPEEAAESFRAAIARNPGDAQVYSNLAVALSELGRSEEAIASCRLGLARSKSVKVGEPDAPALEEAKAPRYRRELGSALFIQGREAEAEAEWLGSLEELRKAGLSLVHFNSNFEFSETRYQEARAAEDAAFRHHVGQGPLLEMLRAVRRRENTSDWLLTWARESAGRFRGARLVSYGVTYFQAWREASSVHGFFTALLLLDLLLVVVSLELQIQIGLREKLAISRCLTAYEEGTAIPAYLQNQACNAKDLAPCDMHHDPDYQMAHHLHYVEVGLARVSIGILVMFMLENLALFIGVGKAICGDFFYMLDVAVVSISLLLELWATIEAREQAMAFGLLVTARVWRFFRVAHGVYFLEHEHDSSESESDESF
ncbi:unnamed protein product [Effrenium voratum]|nr:unnamed protein product [Effrenium voratum]